MSALCLNNSDKAGAGVTALQRIGRHSIILRSFASSCGEQLMQDIQVVATLSPFRHMTTRRGFNMAAAMTNCGNIGWLSDQRGYRYDEIDPLTGHRWPDMPASFYQLAVSSAAEAGFAGFSPDVCLINRYTPGAGMGLHQDKDEQDFSAPIVSISLGVPAIFVFGGNKRRDMTAYFLLEHGDVVVWGGEDRLRFHGIKPLKLAYHPMTGQQRFNLTLRHAR